MEALEKMLVNETVSSMEQSIDLYTAGTVGLYTPRPIDMAMNKPMGPGLGALGGLGSPGCVRHEPNYLYGGTERYRKPEFDQKNGYHINYEQTIPGIKKPISNIHIPMD